MPSSMVINTNLSSLTAQMYLSRNNSTLQESMQRLSSGMRINSAADDAIRIGYRRWHDVAN